MSIQNRGRFFALTLIFCLQAFAWLGVEGFAATFQDQTSQFFPSGMGSSSQVAWGDFNNDGFVDVATGGVIYRNDGGTTFSLVGGPSAGDAIWGDYNNDGNLDLFGYASKKLLENNGSGSFVDVSSKLPSFGSHNSKGAAWADLNNDGSLDLYVGGYEDLDLGQTFADVILTY